MKSRLRWLPLVVAPLLYLPLRAAESPPPEPEAADEAQAPEAAAGSTPAPADPERTPEKETPPAAGGGESLSLDNNISFPVDI